MGTFCPGTMSLAARGHCLTLNWVFWWRLFRICFQQQNMTIKTVCKRKIAAVSAEKKSKKHYDNLVYG